MKTAGISELKQELTNLPPHQLQELCLRLAKFKKENKELLTYLLFEAHDEEGYTAMVKHEIDEGFTELPKPNIYLTKKSLRKILRITGKHIRYMGSKSAEADLLIYFCHKIRESNIPIQQSPVLTNLYNNQLKKINSVISTMHEDLQYDFLKRIKEFV
jgi:hypothetical protein